jgi:hypothetical protein
VSLRTLCEATFEPAKSYAPVPLALPCSAPPDLLANIHEVTWDRVLNIQAGSHQLQSCLQGRHVGDRTAMDFLWNDRNRLFYCSAVLWRDDAAWHRINCAKLPNLGVATSEGDQPNTPCVPILSLSQARHIRPSGARQRRNHMHLQIFDDGDFENDEGQSRDDHRAAETLLDKRVRSERRRQPSADQPGLANAQRRSVHSNFHWFRCGLHGSSLVLSVATRNQNLGIHGCSVER